MVVAAPSTGLLPRPRLASRTLSTSGDLMMRKSVLSFFGFLLCAAAFALGNLRAESISESAEQSLEGPAEQSFEGIVRQRGWTKSKASYCHGGSSYYILELADETLTIGSARSGEVDDELLTELGEFEDKEVRVRGSVVSRTYNQEEHCPDSRMQCIVGSITCTYIEITQIGALEIEE